jgi:hypothetical protein
MLFSASSEAVLSELCDSDFDDLCYEAASLGQLRKNHLSCLRSYFQADLATAALESRLRAPMHTQEQQASR